MSDNHYFWKTRKRKRKFSRQMRRAGRNPDWVDREPCYIFYENFTTPIDLSKNVPKHLTLYTSKSVRLYPDGTPVK